MKIEYLRLAPLLFLQASFVIGAPPMPRPEVDPVLFKGTTPREFFLARESLAPCRKDLASARDRYLAEKSALEKMSVGTEGAAEMDAQGDKVASVREKWLLKLAECGPCADRIELQKVPSPGHTEYWYVGDGSCLVPPGIDSAAAFGAKMKGLLTADSYRHYVPGGLPSVLEFFFVDTLTGKLLPDPTMPLGQTFGSFVAIRGPEILGSRSAFGYYYRNETELREQNGVKEYVHQFFSEKPPAGFRYPQVFRVLPSGKKQSAQLVRLSRVQGLFYLTDQGYLRYYTAADFGMDLDYAKHIAHLVLMETIATTFERGVGVVP